MSIEILSSYMIVRNMPNKIIMPGFLKKYVPSAAFVSVIRYIAQILTIFSKMRRSGFVWYRSNPFQNKSDQIINIGIGGFHKGEIIFDEQYFCQIIQKGQGAFVKFYFALQTYGVSFFLLRLKILLMSKLPPNHRVAALPPKLPIWGEAVYRVALNQNGQNGFYRSHLFQKLPLSYAIHLYP